MKTIFTLLMTFLSTMAIAQAGFVHTATAATISADASYIDHPDLNNNPDAMVLVSHSWNPPGSSGVYNDAATGVFYSNSQGRWGVYMESGLGMVENSSYNVYIGQGSDVTLHVADVANQGSNPGYSVLSHPNLNNNPNANIILTTYYNPNSVRNDFNYGVWYDDGDGRWNIYTEDFGTIPEDAAFFVGVDAEIGTMDKHVANAGNISSNWTAIDHPLLNGNPNAVFTFTHNWGTTGDSANVVIDQAMGAWYTGSSWAIYMEDGSTAFPENAEFDLLIYDPALGVEDASIEGLTYFPNPVKNVLNVSASTEISKVTVFDILGKQVAQQEGSQTTLRMDLSSLATGNYIAQIESENTVQTVKVMKQ